MAAQDDNKSGDDNALPLTWQKGSVAEITGTTAVKDQFWKKAGELGFKSKDKEYNPTNSGISLLLMGGFHWIGVVKLSQPKTVGGFYASIRVSQIRGTIEGPGPYVLEGFIISISSSLNFVDVGQYVIEYPPPSSSIATDWIPRDDNSLKLLQNAMNGVKDEFFKIAKERGYDPPNKEYHPTDTGICKLLSGGQHFIGLVRLAKPDVLGGYWASIRVSQVVGTQNPMPYVLQGFIISVYPWLQFVNEGVYQFDSGVAKVADGKEMKMMAIKPSVIKNDINNTTLWVNGQMNYIPTQSVQGNIDYLKSQILSEAGVVESDLKTFQIASASVCNARYVCFILCFVFSFCFLFNLFWLNGRAGIKPLFFI